MSTNHLRCVERNNHSLLRRRTFQGTCYTGTTYNGHSRAPVTLVPPTTDIPGHLLHWYQLQRTFQGTCYTGTIYNRNQQPGRAATGLSNNRGEQQPGWATTGLSNNRGEQQPGWATTGASSNRGEQQLGWAATGASSNWRRQYHTRPDSSDFFTYIHQYQSGHNILSIY